MPLVLHILVTVILWPWHQKKARCQESASESAGGRAKNGGLVADRDPRNEQAKQYEDKQDYPAAGAIYHQLWDESGSAYAGSRYAYCLRRSGHPKPALNVANKVLARFPDNVYVRREAVWAMYEAQLRPAKARGDLDALLAAANQIVDFSDNDLAVRLSVNAVIDLAKDKNRWDLVSEWCDRLSPLALSADPRNIGGRRVISEREQWYFAKVKSLVRLKSWTECRQLAQEAYKAFPRQRDFARWAARAAAELGQVSAAVSELRNLFRHGRPSWYMLADLAEFQLRAGMLSEAYQSACQAALADGEERAKVGLFGLIAQSALGLGTPDVAARHAALARLVRVREGWRIPDSLAQLESSCLHSCEELGVDLDGAEDLANVAAACRLDWERAVPAYERDRSQVGGSRRGIQAFVADSGMLTGRIKMYKEDQGYGFIVPDEPSPDLFFHIRDTQGIDIPQPGMAVSYQTSVTDRGPRAVNVRQLADPPLPL